MWPMTMIHLHTYCAIQLKYWILNMETTPILSTHTYTNPKHTHTHVETACQDIHTLLQTNIQLIM